MAEENERPKTRDFWDKADIGSKWLIPVVVAFATIWFSAGQGQHAEKQKAFEVAVGILQAPPSAATADLRGWALAVFQEVTGNAYGN